MDTTAPQIGIAIKQCTDFMSGVYREISALYVDLDEVLKEANWASAWYSNLSFHTNSNAIDQLHLRFPRTMGRVYARMPASGLSRHAVVIEVHLSPSFGADEAMIILAVVAMGSELAPGQIAELYRDNNYFMGTLLRAGEYTLRTAKALAPQERRGVFANAPDVHIVTWPLTEMTSRDAISRTVVAQLSQLAPVHAFQK